MRFLFSTLDSTPRKKAFKDTETWLFALDQWLGKKFSPYNQRHPKISEVTTEEYNAYTDGIVTLNTTNWTDIQSVDFYAAGMPCHLHGNFVCTGVTAFTNYRFVRVQDAVTTTVWQTNLATGLPSHATEYRHYNFSSYDTPGVGDVTYKLQGKRDAATALDVLRRTLMVVEFKG